MNGPMGRQKEWLARLERKEWDIRARINESGSNKWERWMLRGGYKNQE